MRSILAVPPPGNRGPAGSELLSQLLVSHKVAERKREVLKESSIILQINLGQVRDVALEICHLVPSLDMFVRKRSRSSEALAPRLRARLGG